jgi:streptogramin lyase
LLCVVGACLATLTLTTGLAMADPTVSPTPNPAPTITEFPIPGGQTPFTLTRGPDGNMWSVIADPPTIVRILSHAPYTVTEFPVPTDDSYVSDITTGPDGNLWFTEQGDIQNEAAMQPGKIGRILPHAPYTITEFNTADPQNRPRPFKIVTGPDRNLYIAELCDHGATAKGRAVVSCAPNVGGAVERITPFGSDARIQASVTQVARTTPCTEFCNALGDIIVGPDHNLWLADYTHIDRLTIPRADPKSSGSTRGVGYTLTQFPLPNGVLVFDMTTGIDGNLWFTGGFFGGNQIGRISPRDPSNIKVYPASATNTAPDATGITTGPDGKLWYAELLNNTIGTFSPFAPDKLTEFKLPVSGAHPFAVADGPCDDTIWFTDETGFIGRIQLPGPLGLPGITGLIGSGLAGDLQSLLTEVGLDVCRVPPRGTSDGGQ